MRAFASRQARSFHCRKVIERSRSRAPVFSGDRRAWTVSICPRVSRSFMVGSLRERFTSPACGRGRRGCSADVAGVLLQDAPGFVAELGLRVLVEARLREDLPELVRIRLVE